MATLAATPVRKRGLRNRSIHSPTCTNNQVGLQLQALLNQNAAFSYQEPDVKVEGRFLYPPLVSRHNLATLRNVIRDTLSGSRVEAVRKLQQGLQRVARFCVNKHRPGIGASIVFGGTVLLLAACSLTALCHVTLLHLLGAVYLILSSLGLLLFDVKDLQQLTPPWLLRFVAKLSSMAMWFDSHVLCAMRFQGREWNEFDFEWDQSLSASSRTSSLWDVPPPSIQQGRRLSLDRDYLALHYDWSPATVEHVVGINFCYIMLREENLRKVAGKRKRLKRIAETNYAMVEEELLLPLPASKRPQQESEVSFVRSDASFDARASPRGTKSESVTVLSTDARHRRVRSRDSDFAEAIELKMTPKRGLVRSQSDGSLYAASDCLSPDEDAGDREEADVSITSIDMAADMPWFDVGAKIGIRLLNSAHLQRAMTSQEATERFIGIGKTVESRFKHGDLVDSAISPLRVPSEAASSSLADYTTPPRRTLRRNQIHKPTHAMWTSPSAAARPSSPTSSSPSLSDDEDCDTTHLDATQQMSPKLRARPVPPSRPPLSPPRFVNRKRRSSEGIGREMTLKEHFFENRTTPDKKKFVLEIVAIKASDEPNVVDMAADRLKELLATTPKTLEEFASNVIGVADRLWDGSNSRLENEGDRSVYSPVLDASGEKRSQRVPLRPGVKVAVPLFPYNPASRHALKRITQLQFQMGTVECSARIHVSANHETEMGDVGDSNCLSVTVKMDKSFLRQGEFATLTYRVMDEWSSRYVPRHSKVPVGSCVATSYGIGILVGWRVEDDCHVVRSLWQRRGHGSAHSYMNRKAILGTIEAAVGFRVETNFGWGVVLAYVDGALNMEAGRFIVSIQEEGRHKGHVLELNRHDILSCNGAQFIPIIEHIREAAYYQIQVDNYKAVMRDFRLDSNIEPSPERMMWESCSACADILWRSFLKAVEEDEDFDEGVNEFMTTIINFLERLDRNSNEDTQEDPTTSQEIVVEGSAQAAFELEYPLHEEKATEPGFWIIHDIFGGIFKAADIDVDNKENIGLERPAAPNTPGYFDRAFAVIRTLMTTVSIAQAESVDHHHFRLALAIFYDFLLFVRTVIKVQQKNMSAEPLKVWKEALTEIAGTFGPIKERLVKIGHGIAQRMEKQGRKAKIRLLQFVDTILGDERLLLATEQGEWDQCVVQVEYALVKSDIIEEKNLQHYRKTARFIYHHICSVLANEGLAAARNNAKLMLLAKAVQWIASPRRSALSLLLRDDVLQMIERMLVRVYHKEESASRTIAILASNFQSLRHLRLLKDFSISGRLWLPILDAADEEFSWIVSHMPENAKEFMCLLSKLFSLCVAQFHKINAGDNYKDWLDFLLEDDAVRIIHDIDMKVILALRAFSRDVKDMTVVLPYYSSIDDDILKLMDEVDLDQFLREASAAIDDPETLAKFIREKATLAIERFLNYLPKMSIPVERRDLGEGWVLSCRGEDGGDLTLSDVTIEREDLVCQIMGGDALFMPLMGEVEGDIATIALAREMERESQAHSLFVEESILDSVRELLLLAESHGAWVSGIGGVGQQPTDPYIATALHGLALSSVLNCAIELWRNLEIDDDELMEIAIRDVSFQIKLQQEREEAVAAGSEIVEDTFEDDSDVRPPIPECVTGVSSSDCTPRTSYSFDSIRRRFNPRVDPTVLFLEMKNLTLQLDKFLFRIEKSERRTMFDPVFEGRGALCVQNVSIKIRVQCAKERIQRNGLGVDSCFPVLQLREFDVGLEKVKLRVNDTGFGSDWLLNKAVTMFGENITKAVKENLKDQVLGQARQVIENLNSYFMVNPNILLDLLGISMEDLEEKVVWV